MQSYATKRASRPKAARFSGAKPESAAHPRPDHAACHGRATARTASAARRTSGQLQAQTGASMAYQLGFTSGPSS